MSHDARDKERAELVWDERISPTLAGRFTVNRGGIISCIARVGAEARHEGREEVRAVLLGIVALGLWARRANALREAREYTGQGCACMGECLCD